MKLLAITFILLLLYAAPSSKAAITVLDYYRLGDADTGASAGTAGNSTTTDSAGSVNLGKSGSPTYSSSVAYPSVAGRANMLSLSVSSASGDQYSVSSVLTSATDNFGVEAWINTSTITGNSVFVGNGKPITDQFGLVRNGSVYQGLLGNQGNILVGSTPATLNTWINLALVRNQGVATFYVNGVAAGTSTATPLAPSSGFEIGNGFTGLIDEVRVFTFAPGAFTTKDLLVNQVPEPTTGVLLFVGVSAALVLVRRQRKSSFSTLGIHLPVICTPEQFFPGEHHDCQDSQAADD